MNSYRICILVNRVRNLLKPQSIMTLRITDDLPDEVELNSIYITGNKAKWFFLTMKCPCGCQEAIELNLNQSDSPKWQVEWHINGTISLSPSINRTKGCGSHFFYKNGKINWCKN